MLLGSGIYGQSLYIDLAAEQTSIVKLSTWPEALDLKLAEQHLRAFEASSPGCAATPPAKRGHRRQSLVAGARRPVQLGVDPGPAADVPK